MFDASNIRQVVRSVIKEEMGSTVSETGAKFVPVAISGRHVHLSHNDIGALFGQGYQLTKFKDLSQPGQYAAKEQVTVVGPKGVIERVRVLGPARKATQVEISRTDAFRLGVKPPVRDSGAIDGTPGITLAGPGGCIYIKQGVILAARHIHLSPQDAEVLGLMDRQRVKVRTSGERSIVFENVLVRVHKEFSMDMHLDPDEANAAFLFFGVKVLVMRD